MYFIPNKMEKGKKEKEIMREYFDVFIILILVNQSLSIETCRYFIIVKKNFSRIYDCHAV